MLLLKNTPNKTSQPDADERTERNMKLLNQDQLKHAIEKVAKGEWE